MSFIDVVLGRPLASDEDHRQKIDVKEGIPIFGLDALGSAAYGPEAALTILIPLGMVGTQYILPLSAAIIGLLAIVYFSYRQTIEAYPHGGGSYTVASQNLGLYPGLLAAAALMIDYILVVAVGIAAGVGALVSAVPSLQSHTLTICLGILVVIALINLRGVRDAGWAFMAPTYIFVGCLMTVVLVGMCKSLLHLGHPTPVVAPPTLVPTTGAISAWLLLKAFSSGCTAMTGVEAVSNGVMAFRDPKEKTAQKTLTVIIGVLMLLLAGIAYLSRVYHIGATLPGSGNYESVLSQITGAVVGKGIFYYITIGSILTVLSLQANTAFADFPRLCHALAQNGYMPRTMANRGRRLVYSQGIYVLVLLAALLLIAFGGITDRLIPLFAIGAFLAFTMSQAGMVAHWRRVGGRHAKHSMLINGLGAIATAATVIVVAISKFSEGAWITLFVIPALLATMVTIRKHYDKVAEEIEAPMPLSVENLSAPLVVVPVEQWSKIAQRTLRFALAISKSIHVLHIDNEECTSDLHDRWQELVEEPTRKAGLPVPELVVLKSPYRLTITPILKYVLEMQRRFPERQIAVVVPDIIQKHWYEYFLHSHRGKLLALLLVFKGNQRISVINLPWHLEEGSLEAREMSAQMAERLSRQRAA